MKVLPIIVLSCILTIAMTLAVNAESAKKYQCPMHPQVVSDKPGECPICHMRLVLVSMEPANVEITARERELIGIKTEKVIKRHLATEVYVPGEVVHDLDLFNAQIEYIKALKSTRLYVRSDSAPRPRRLEPLFSDEAKIKLMEMGMDEESIAEFTEFSNPDMSLLHLGKEPGEWIYLNVYESDLSFIHRGDKVRVELPGVTNARPLEAEIKSISPYADPKTRTIKIRAFLKEGHDVLKPNMQVNCIIIGDLGENLSISKDAPLWSGNEMIVFVKKGESSFEPRAVTLGPKTGNFYPVLEGLMEGEEIIAQGNFFIDSDSRLKSAINEANSAENEETHKGAHK